MAPSKNYFDRVTPEQVIKIYSENDQIITVDQANQIIEFLYMIAEIALDSIEKEIQEEKSRKKKSDGSNS